jgi:CRISPR-associated protein Cmr5
MEQTIQQKRAKFALENITALKPLSDFESEKKEEVRNKMQKSFEKEFVSYANSLPAMIHTNGLGQAMAFCCVKGKKSIAYKKLYDIVSKWLCKEGQIYHNCGGDILHGITHKDIHEYQLAQAEALVLLSWVKKFAKAFLAEE